MALFSESILSGWPQGTYGTRVSTVLLSGGNEYSIEFKESLDPDTGPTYAALPSLPSVILSTWPQRSARKMVHG
jgi:hypothetical protein